MEPLNWQIDLSTIRERTKYAFNNSLFCDVEFLVVDSDGDEVVVSAHKFVLAVTSPVFAAMFYGQLAESKSPISLPDCTKEGFQELLRFAYSEEVNITGNNLMEILYLADKYMIPSLSDKCREYFVKKVRPQNVFQLLPGVLTISDKSFEELCWGIVDTETQQAVSSSSFLNISHELLCQVLGRDNLRVKEMVLFEAVDRWALRRIEEKGLDSNGERKRAILGEEVIRMIRFPLMSEKEFAKEVLPSKILKMDEVTELIQNFSELPAVATSFVKKDRQAKDRLLISNDEFDTVQIKLVEETQCETILSFEVNKSVKLYGFRMFGIPDCSYNVVAIVGRYLTDGCRIPLSPLGHKINNIETEEEKIDGYSSFTVFIPESQKLVEGVKFWLAVAIMESNSQSTLFPIASNSKTVVDYEDVKLTYGQCEYEHEDIITHVVEGRGQIHSLILQNSG